MLDVVFVRDLQGMLLRLSGEFVSANAARLRALPLPLPRTSRLDLDLSGVTAVDRPGLAAFVAFLLEARRLGTKVRLKGARPELAKLIHAEGLDRLAPLAR